jgi:hypothetical protein
MAPEQVRNQAVDGRADVFALGVVLWEILARARLFQFDDPLKALQAVLSAEPVAPPTVRNPEAPPALVAIAMRALERDPQRRYQSAAEFQLALEAWLKLQPDAPTNRELADYMGGLFAERIVQQARLVEQARTEDVHRVRPLTDASGSSAMPGSRSGRMESASRVGLYAVAAAGLVLVAGGGAYLALTPRAQAPEPMLLPTMVLEPLAPTVLEVATEPPGAGISVNGNRVGRSPVSLERLELRAHRVHATLEGHLDAEQEVAIGSEGHRASVLLQLAPAPAPPPTAVAAPAPVKPRPLATRGG